MAEGAGLENRYMRTHIAGSNPALSAIQILHNTSSARNSLRLDKVWPTDFDLLIILFV